MAAQQRLSKELTALLKDPPENISASLINDNVFEWNAIIIGPKDTPYEGGLFKLKIVFPDNYPFRPPKVQFTTRVFHPNINQKGDICLDILRDEWKPTQSIRTVLLSICSLLDMPNPDNPLDAAVANLYLSDQEKYKRTAAEWTRRYAV